MKLRNRGYSEAYLATLIRALKSIAWRTEFEETGSVLSSATAKTVEEAANLMEQGFDSVTDLDGVKLFRKHK